MIKILKGLDLPIAGMPLQQISPAPAVKRVALLGEEYVGMRPAMAVKEGDRVKKVRSCSKIKRSTGVCFTAPASGIVSAIHRGERRVLQSVVIDIEGNDAVAFTRYAADALAELPRDTVQQQLLASGQWTALRTRPFSKTPLPGARPPLSLLTPWTPIRWRRSRSRLFWPNVPPSTPVLPCSRA